MDKLILITLILFLGILGTFLLSSGFSNIYKIQREEKELQIENLRIENEIKRLQLKEYGFEFTEESEQVAEE